MSAGEEIFAHRSQFPNEFAPGVRSKVVVISDDSELRATVAGILNAMNCECTKLPLSASAIRSHLAAQRDSNQLAILDLDEATGEVQECLEVLDTNGRMNTSVGMSVFSHALKNSATRAESRLLHIVEKTELLLQLRRLMNRS